MNRLWIIIAGVHYIVPRTEQNLIFGKRDKTGIFAAKTKSAVLIACYKGENAAEVRVAVEKLAQYLMDSGYWNFRIDVSDVYERIFHFQTESFMNLWVLLF